MTAESRPLADRPGKKYDWKFRLLLAVAPRLFYLVAQAIYRTCRITMSLDGLRRLPMAMEWPSIAIPFPGALWPATYVLDGM